MNIRSTFAAIGLSFAFVCCSGSDGEVATLRNSLLAGMNFYYGNLHAHTKYSDGRGTPAEGYAFGRDMAQMDFYSITDHAELLSDSEWSDLENQANAFNQDGAFVALRGFEYSNFFLGHINVFDTSAYKSLWTAWTLTAFYGWLDGRHGIGQFNHPGDPGDFEGFRNNGGVLDDMALLETANGGTTNASGAYLGYYDAALRKGWKVAPTGNNDNHSLADSGRRTVIVASELTRAGLLSAMRSRRIYSSDDHNLEVAFALQGAWMGSTVEGAAGDYSFDVTLLDDEPIARVELIAMGAVADQWTPAPEAREWVWHPTLHVISNLYAYLKVTEADGDVAVTAPIWIAVP